jgi:hypothetical protein
LQVKPSGTIHESRVISDLWWNKNDTDYFMSIKTVKPNIDQTAVAKKDMLMLKVDNSSCGVYFGLYYNPYGKDKTSYAHNPPMGIFDFRHDNVVLIGKDVDQVIESFKSRLPKDIIFDKVLYQPEDIGKSINDFILNLLEGVLFVVIVVFVSMGMRNALIVSTAIPVSMISTFIVMRFADIKLHQISVAALIIALGMLVDNAIVVSDAIQVRIDNGQEKTEACV